MYRWGWNQAEKEKSIHIPQPQKVYKNQRVIDPNRKVISLWTSDHYGVIADEFGRVLLFDIELGVLLKIWKGYSHSN